jgi:glutamate racemase
LPRLSGRYSVPVSGILEPACAAAAKATKSGKIGVIATSASVNSGAYIKEISSLIPNAEIIQTACPLFVPLVEGGFIGRDCEITRLTAKHYLADIKAAGCDTLLLGCTHYPIIADIIGDELEGVTLNAEVIIADEVIYNRSLTPSTIASVLPESGEDDKGNKFNVTVTGELYKPEPETDAE